MHPGLLVGILLLLVGALAAWVGWVLGTSRAQAQGLLALADERHLRAVAETQVQDLGTRLRDERALIENADKRLGDTFRALAAEALAANNSGFLTLATERMSAVQQDADAQLEARRLAIEGLVGPVRESLSKVDGQIHELEKERGQAYGRLMEQVNALRMSHDRLQTETGNLARALRSPSARGRWGDMQLRRVVELAGMVEHCDFQEQKSVAGDDRRLRPDMLVSLPGGRCVVVDAKVPLDAYLKAVEATTEEDRRARLKEHAQQVRAHVTRLGAKSYWADLATTPEFVVMFLPSEAIFGASLEDMPTLIEEGVERRVLLATPTTLIALLMTVHYGWRQERVAHNAAAISELGRVVHDRLAVLIEHWARLGGALEKATEHFNGAAASFEGRVVPVLRRLQDLGAQGQKEIVDLKRVDVRPRNLDVATG